MRVDSKRLDPDTSTLALEVPSKPETVVARDESV